ncbi:MULTISPECIES: anti-phage dCTP deaminase [Shewanella]|uniref:anti-phage dCTP deaminase n=1 Tax=Shewanella TaxID=22 RepID=UPI000C5D1A14|nr:MULTISPECIES: anti-phage dCTP deaminase [Shewanella]NCQ45154.1 cytidine deaminase [Shewanella frigidimarina]NCO70858.1 cytidine deaminase [Shewanella vesiculosa]NCP36975.1 cytidine deaminase [Shewanella vesiculosa]NCP68932.1 cytidine deaminase [Shewanella vesiculosa]NCP74312.1 cytidine deaminase [Shewanella vesiculosa]
MDTYAPDSEVVIGLVTPVGVNYDDIRSRFETYFDRYQYKSNWLHLSKLFGLLINNESTELLSEGERLQQAMTIGNNLRQDNNRDDIMALVVINAILSKRERDSENSDRSKPLSRTAHIIRSLKHPDEVETLRTVYGKGFMLVGITANESSRIKYLMDQKGVETEEKARELIERDDRENDLPTAYGEHGQSTRDVFQLSDFFLTIDTVEEFDKQLQRIFNLLFAKPVVSPDLDEYAMFLAYAASLRSADLSRQVGAVVVGHSGDIISTGANDVPKKGGGLYWPNQDDQRDHIFGCDTNEREKKIIALKILKEFDSYKTDLSEDDNYKIAKKRLKETGILDITEYGRAVHAEMEALMSAARTGTSVLGATLYTTTFPCHNCAKHIVAAGIDKVVFIEPYPKSFATKLHSDSIEVEKGDRDKTKVQFYQFAGVGPRKFIDLFSMKLGNGRKLIRKKSGKLAGWDRQSAELRIPLVPLSYLESEFILDAELQEILQKHKDSPNDK